jgi:FkbM family methyltransferase
MQKSLDRSMQHSGTGRVRMDWIELRLRTKRFRSKLKSRLSQGGYATYYHLHGRDIQIEHRGIANDIAAINGCFRDGQYEIPKVRAGYAELARTFYTKIVAAGKRPLIVDCGANIGAASLWFRGTYPDAHIVAVEPAFDNFEYLTRNTADWGIERVRAGIDATDGVATLYDPGFGPDGYRMDPNGAGEKIAMVSVETIVQQNSASSVPFILKVDIEGYEARLFEQPTQATASFPIIIVEPHDWLLPGQGTALNFFKFHSSNGRDFLYGNENVFSIDYSGLQSDLEGYAAVNHTMTVNSESETPA